MENNQIVEWFFDEIIDYSNEGIEIIEDDLQTTKGLLNEMQKIFLKIN
jgi:hypothetical protein